VWDTLGHIVTNNHVVDGSDSIQVTFSDGTVRSGELVGADADSDLAVIKVDLEAVRLHPVTLASSTEVKVGQLAIAIGNPFALENTMTVGIVSAVGRVLPVDSSGSGQGSYSIPDIIQTDAPINPGNSGGVLVDDQGQLIGVTAAIASPVRASAGVGFAIPSDIVRRVVPALIETGRYEHTWLGISGGSLTSDLAQVMNLDVDQRGALIIDIVPGGPADQADLRGSSQELAISGQPFRVGGDVITAIDGQAIDNFEDLVAFLARNTEVGQQVTLSFLRDGETETVTLVLAARPSS
jgi:2-alkenal reductase